MIITHTPVTEAAWKTIEQWTECIKNRDINAAVSLYSEKDNAFWGTFGDHLRRTPAEVKTYFDVFLNCESIRCEILDCAARELTSEVASFSGSYKFYIVKKTGDDEIQAVARFTYTVRHNEADGGWKIVEHHSSLMPESGY